MSIQLVTYDQSLSKFASSVDEINLFNQARVFDDFDINIIDLNNKKIWYCNSNTFRQVNCQNDLKTLGNMINSAHTSSIIILPSNFKLYYDYSADKYWYSKQLKDMLKELCDYILNDIIAIPATMSFGTSYTELADIEVKNDFYFQNVKEEQIITHTQSGVVTTIKVDNVFITTLQLNNDEALSRYLSLIGLSNNDKLPKPEWVDEYKFYNDVEQREIITSSKKTIKEENEKIKNAKKVLDQNDKWKSILYSNGQELVDTVFDIIKQLLGVNLDEFADELKEDFSFKYNDKIVIGEIKGVTSGVQNRFLSQLDNNKFIYLDNHPDERSEVVALLIVNQERNRAPSERDAVAEDQISLAKRNGSLIIETSVLLKMLELYFDGKLTQSDCWNLMSCKKNILTMDDLLS